jgi:hypothetical protein
LCDPRWKECVKGVGLSLAGSLSLVRMYTQVAQPSLRSFIGCRAAKLRVATDGAIRAWGTLLICLTETISLSVACTSRRRRKLDLHIQHSPRTASGSAKAVLTIKSCSACESCNVSKSCGPNCQRDCVGLCLRPSSPSAITFVQCDGMRWRPV